MQLMACSLIVAVILSPTVPLMIVVSCTHLIPHLALLTLILLTTVQLKMVVSCSYLIPHLILPALLLLTTVLLAPVQCAKADVTYSVLEISKPCDQSPPPETNSDQIEVKELTATPVYQLFESCQTESDIFTKIRGTVEH